MQKAAIYARVSGDDRAKEGRNLESQLQMCREYAARLGCRVIAELAEDDRGAGGADRDLPQLVRLLEMAQAGEIEVLVVREMDRLARSLVKQLLIEEQLQGLGVAIEYVLGDYPDTPEGQLSKHIRAVISDYERQKIRERVIRGRRNAARAGRVVMSGGRPPYGSSRSEDGSQLVVYEPEAEIVRTIFRWYVTGDENDRRLSSVKIADRLREARVPTYEDTHGIVTKRAGFAAWYSGRILAILHNETYAGRWLYGRRGPKEVIAVAVPSVVSRDIWDAAQVQAVRNRIISANVNRRHDYLLQGCLVCGRCGHSVYSMQRVVGGKQYRYYVCGARTRHGQACDLPYFRAGDVDTVVWTWICNLLLDPDRLRAGLLDLQQEQASGDSPLHAEIARLDTRIAGQETQLERLLDLYLAAAFDVDALQERRERIESGLDALRSERATFAARLAAVIGDEEIRDLVRFAEAVGEELRSADFEARRHVVEALQVEGNLSLKDGERSVSFWIGAFPSVDGAMNSRASWRKRSPILLQTTIVL